MDECVGIRRDQQGLSQAARQIGEWLATRELDHPALRNRLEACRLIVNAALVRRQSCGAHARDDDPEFRATGAQVATI
ncbi:hypothetical protein [Diaphorobacter aerolatus]|uniref:hypothetical protein n=1 Tax=Diaphorobacter aerolatus TaxID=1288495 RepID=UPI001D00C8F2|nr:hypothetical protein [Diaphorobacter aerolatus]